MKTSLKTKILFFSFIFIFSFAGIFSAISLVNAQTSDKTNVSANIITVSPTTFYSFITGQTFNFYDDRLGYFDVIPGNPALTSFTPLNPYFINNNTIVYAADAIFTVDVGYSTSFSIDKIYNCNPTYITDPWLTVYTRPDFTYNWTKHVYKFTYSQYPLTRTSNMIDFDGITNFKVSFNSLLGSYQGTSLGYLESNLNQIYSDNYLINDSVANYTNYDSKIFTKNGVSCNYDTSKISLTDIGGDASASFNDWIGANDPGVTVENNSIPVTVQNQYEFPLPQASYVQIKSNQANLASFSVPTQIRPAVTYDYRNLDWANGTCYVDTKQEWLGTSGVWYENSYVTDINPPIRQILDASVQNTALTQKYTFYVRITSQVQLSALENAGINLQTSGFMQSNWYWDNSVFQGGGSFGAGGFQLSPWWMMLIPVAALIFVIVYVSPQLEGGITGFLLGKARNNQKNSRKRKRN